MKILFNQLIAWGRPVEELELAGLTLDCHRRVWSSGQLSTYLKIGIDLSGKCPSDRPHCSVTPVTLTDAMLHTWSHQISIVQQILQTLMSLPPIAILFCKCQVDDLPWFSILADFLRICLSVPKKFNSIIISGSCQTHHIIHCNVFGKVYDTAIVTVLNVFNPTSGWQPVVRCELNSKAWLCTDLIRNTARLKVARGEQDQGF